MRKSKLQTQVKVFRDNDVVLSYADFDEISGDGQLIAKREYKIDDHFLKTIQPKLAPTLTDMEGVFTAGAAAGPKDIVDSITEAGAAAMEASKYMAAMERSKKAVA